MNLEEALDTYAEEYFGRRTPRSFATLRQAQDGRLASVAFGAAGVAYAHWHAARVTGRREWLDGARGWLREAHALRDDRSGFFQQHGPVEPPENWRDLAREAFLHGRIGVDCVRALVADAMADGAELERALGDVLAGCRWALDSVGGGTELYTGLAGNLHAVTLLATTVGDPRLTKLGRELNREVIRRTGLSDDDGCPIRWGEPRGPGLAHGIAGALFALLGWSAATGDPLAPGVRPTLGRLLDGALAEPRDYCPRPVFLPTLCNGFTGLALLAVTAHRHLGDDRFLSDARQAIRHALDAVPPRSDLCCGRAGIASVCLALAAVDDRGPWRQRALELTASALLAEAEDWEVMGLYGGEAALPCLAVDLRAGRSAGPPALTWPGDGAIPRALRSSTRADTERLSPSAVLWGGAP